MAANANKNTITPITLAITASAYLYTPVVG
jgi:hypothetical protein